MVDGGYSRSIISMQLTALRYEVLYLYMSLRVTLRAVQGCVKGATGTNQAEAQTLKPTVMPDWCGAESGSSH
jgi:hypothetical protein